MQRRHFFTWTWWGTAGTVPHRSADQEKNARFTTPFVWICSGQANGSHYIFIIFKIENYKNVFWIWPLFWHNSATEQRRMLALCSKTINWYPPALSPPPPPPSSPVPYHPPRTLELCSRRQRSRTEPSVYNVRCIIYIVLRCACPPVFWGELYHVIEFKYFDKTG